MLIQSWTQLWRQTCSTPQKMSNIVHSFKVLTSLQPKQTHHRKLRTKHWNREFAVTSTMFGHNLPGEINWAIMSCSSVILDMTQCNTKLHAPPLSRAIQCHGSIVHTNHKLFVFIAFKFLCPSRNPFHNSISLHSNKISIFLLTHHLRPRWWSEFCTSSARRHFHHHHHLPSPTAWPFLRRWAAAPICPFSHCCCWRWHWWPPLPQLHSSYRIRRTSLAPKARSA